MADRSGVAGPARARFWAIVASACVGLAPVAARPLFGTATIERTERHLGDWRLSVERSRFSGDVACRLRSRDHRISYTAGALAFAFGRHDDPTQGWYRIDGGAAQRIRDALPELARLDVVAPSTRLDAPTGGLVLLPAAWLAEANRVDIQPLPGKRSHSFHLRGFAGLRDIARTMGCEPEVRFVR